VPNRRQSRWQSRRVGKGHEMGERVGRCENRDVDVVARARGWAGCGTNMGVGNMDIAAENEALRVGKAGRGSSVVTPKVGKVVD